MPLPLNVPSFATEEASIPYMHRDKRQK